jgi:hypothetical protein
MKITTPLGTFFNKIIPEQRINTSHISIYIVLYHYWFNNQFQNPIHITRADVMKKSKINSRASYHKCIKDLHTLGFINYDPSYHPIEGSKVCLANLNNE